MKKIQISILIACLVAVIFFTSCEETETPTPPPTSTVYNNTTFPGFLKINGANVATTQLSGDINSSYDVVNASALPSGNFNSFEVSLFIPVDGTVSLFTELDEANLVVNGNQNVPPFYQGGQSVGIDNNGGDGVSRQHYRFNFTYPANAGTPVNASNLTKLEFVWDVEYTDNSSGSVIHNKHVEFDVEVIQ